MEEPSGSGGFPSSSSSSSSSTSISIAPPPPTSSIEDMFIRLNLRDFRDNSKKPICSSPLTIEIKAYGVIILTCILVFTYVYAAFISPFVPATGYWLVDEMKNDNYYCYLIPIMILPTYIVIYLNWLSLRVFESN